MAVGVDYYDLLNIGRTASTDEINEAVKKQMRQWRKRTEAADLGVRQEAEVRVKLIEEARATLTDQAKRRSYDAELAQGGVRRSEVPASPSGTNWVEQARHFLSVGDYHSAAYAAREATQQSGNTAECWYLRSRANAGLDRYDDAWYEAQQAVQIEGRNAEYHFNAGMVAEEMGRPRQAIEAYKSAARLDSAPMYELAIGGVLIQQGDHRQALEIISRVYERVPNDPNANYYYGMALIEAAENVPAVRDGESYVVTSPDEIATMRSLLAKARTLNSPDPSMVDGVRHIEQYLESMEKKTFNIAFLGAAIGAGFDGGAGAGCMAIIAIPFLFLIPGIMVLFGLATLTQGFGFFFLIVGGLLLTGEYYLFWRPGWKINRSIHRGQ